MLNARISHIALGTDEPGRARHFYEDNVGLTPSETLNGAERLSLGSGHHVLELVPGEGLDHFALEVPEAAELKRLEERLDEHAVATEWVEPPGEHPPALRFKDPGGHVIEAHERIDRSGERGGDTGRRPVRLHHVTVTAPDVPALADFYVDVLGFAVSDRMGDSFMWLRCNREHHTVAIVNGPVGGVDHYCYEIGSWADLKLWCDDLAVKNVAIRWGPGRHGPGNNLFVMFDDTAGFHVELSCEIERFWDDRVTYPEPRVWNEETRTVNLWGAAPDWRQCV